MQISHHNERMTDRDGFATIDIEYDKLSFRGRWYDGFYDLRDVEESPIVGRVTGVVREGEMAANADSLLGF